MIALFILSATIAVVLFAVSAGTLCMMLHAWQTPDNYGSAGFARARRNTHSFSIIVPCRDEEYEVMTATTERLLAQTHGCVEVVISVGDDDHATVQRALTLARLHPTQVRVSINKDRVKNKPRQLNSALQACKGDIIGIMDAESLASPGLIEHIDGTFQDTRADVVQGAVHLVNYRSRWFTLRNCLEYRIWFRSRLHGHAKKGFIPLGGNTVFVRRHILDAIGGWDGECLAEDCELGVRLSAMGKKIVCAYEPELTTIEEAPVSVAAFLRQRTRWSLGFMQVLSKGEWKKLPGPRRRFMAWWTLVQQYAMAFAGVVVPIGALTALFVKLPTLVAMLTWLPVAPMAMTVIFEGVALREFGHDMQFKINSRDYAILVLTTPIYQLLLSYAAVVAVFRYTRGNFKWDKTPHAGAHLGVARSGVAPQVLALPTQRSSA